MGLAGSSIIALLDSMEARRSGSSEFLMQAFNDILPPSAEALKIPAFRDPALRWSEEAYFSLVMLSKQLLGEASFHAPPAQGQEYGPERRIYEQGPIIFPPWGPDRDGKPTHDVTMANVMVLALDLRNRDPLIYDEFLALMSSLLPPGYSLGPEDVSEESRWCSLEFVEYGFALYDVLCPDPDGKSKAALTYSLKGTRIVRLAGALPERIRSAFTAQTISRINGFYQFSIERCTTNQFRFSISFPRDSPPLGYRGHYDSCKKNDRDVWLGAMSGFIIGAFSLPSPPSTECLELTDPEKTGFLITLRYDHRTHSIIRFFPSILSLLVPATILLLSPWVFPGFAALASILALSLIAPLATYAFTELLATRKRMAAQAQAGLDQLAELQRTMDDLYAERAFLEKRVEERTAELKEAHQRIAGLDRAKTEFFANSSHELRTPITLIASPLDAIRSGLHGESIPHDSPLFAIMSRNASRLKTLADRLLDFLHLDQGLVRANPIPLDLKAFCGPYYDDFRPAAEVSGLQMELCIEKPIVAMADPAILETILINLFSNALKFTPKDGWIRISASEVADKAVLCVADSGKGIQHEKLSQIFERYAAASWRSRADYSGFGLGLPLSRELARLIGGELSAESEPGRGSVFTLSLPSTSQPPAAHALGASEAPRRITTVKQKAVHREANIKAATLLIIDDDADMREYLNISLSIAFHPALASSAAEALRLIDGGLRPDLILCDLMMPGMDGFSFREELLGRVGMDAIPFLFLSAQADPEARLRGIRSGALDYIEKPFRVEELIAKLRSIVDLSERDKAQTKTFVQDCPWQERARKIGLSDIDIRVIALVLHGKADKEIAAELNYSPRTISNRLSGIMRKTGSPNRAGIGAALGIVSG